MSEPTRSPVLGQTSEPAPPRTPESPSENLVAGTPADNPPMIATHQASPGDSPKAFATESTKPPAFNFRIAVWVSAMLIALVTVFLNPTGEAAPFGGVDELRAEAKAQRSVRYFDAETIYQQELASSELNGNLLEIMSEQTGHIVNALTKLAILATVFVVAFSIDRIAAIGGARTPSPTHQSAAS